MLILAFATVVFAQVQLGSISGKVLGSEDKSPLIGANIILQGTVLGTVTNAQGEFTIQRIPVGNYTLIVSILGFERKLIHGVEVKSDSQTQLLVELLPRPLQTEAVVVSATKRDQSLEEVPVSVSIIDAKTITERNAVSVDEALRYVSGVNVLQTQVNIRGFSGYSRGIGSRVLLLMDGLPLITGDTGEIIWETISTTQVERIEIVKGAGSALYGSSALGGVINVITREIRETPETRVRLYSGLYDKPFYHEWRWSDKTRFLQGFSVSHSQQVNNFGFLLSGGSAADDGYRENDFFHRWNGFGKMKYDFSPYESMTLSFNLLHQRRGSFFFWKSLREALRPDDSQNGFRITTTRWNANVAFKKFVNEKFFYLAKAVYFTNSLQNDSLGIQGSASRARTLNIELQANYDVSASHLLTFGVVGNVDDITADLYGTHVGVGGAGYVQDEVHFAEPLKITAGFRYDVQRVLGLPVSNQWSPKVGVVLTPSSSTTLRASIGRGFRAPSIGEIYISTGSSVAPVVPNPNLRAEQSWSYEVGGTHLFSENLLLDAALFQSDFSKLIEAGFDTTRNGLVIVFKNVPRARIQGGEVSLKMDWFKKLLHIDLGYTYIWPKDLTDNTILRFRSRHLMYSSAFLNYSFLSFGVDFRYISRMDHVDEILLLFIANGDRRVAARVVDARALIDLGQWRLPFKISAHVNNLFQYNYVELIGNIAPIRNFVFTIEGKF